jgi:hypothetical protein
VLSQSPHSSNFPSQSLAFNVRIADIHVSLCQGRTQFS